MPACSICESPTKPSFVAREMMYGLRDAFEYGECSECGCLALQDVPKDWSRYYPSNYYSFAVRHESPIKQLLKRARARSALGHADLLGRLLVSAFGPPEYALWMKRMGLGFDAAILDVGTGRGELLLHMWNAGFRHLAGIDPFTSSDHEVAPGVPILKRELSEVTGEYDCIMFNHSFEHIGEQAAALEMASRLLRRGGHVLIRMPVAGTHAWETYGSDWVQLDAPRHLLVHTERSFRLLAQRTGFETVEVLYDSASFQFWGSEQYRRGIPLLSETSYEVNPGKSMFREDDIRRFEAEAQALNRDGRGDQACFYLRALGAG